MEADEIEITLIAAPDNPSLKTPAYQAELWQFEQSLASQAVEVSSHKSVQLSEPGSLTYFGDFTIKLAVGIGPALITAIAGWLIGKNGRKVRLKIGDIEAEAQTVEEVEKLIARAQEIQEHSQPKTDS